MGQLLLVFSVMAFGYAKQSLIDLGLWHVAEYPLATAYSAYFIEAVVVFRIVK